MGDFSQARSVLDESLAIWLKLDVEGELGLAEALIFKGLVAQSGDGNYDTAQSCYERSLELCQNWKDLRGQAMAMFNLGRVADFRHQEAMAFSWFERSLDLFNQVGELWGVGRTSQLIGQLALKQGNLDKARQFFEQHLGIDERLHFRQGTAIALTNLGDLYRYQADYDRAEQFYQSSLVICREYNLKWDLSITLFFMGLLALHRNNYSLARQQFSDYFNLARTVHEGKIITSDLLISMAAVAAGIHQSERAARLYGAAQALFDSIDYEIPPFDRAEFERHIHQARQQLGDAAFEALVNEGRRMLLEQAVADALEIQTL
jgi:tetratricopeptide (TPR) repeat protein